MSKNMRIYLAEGIGTFTLVFIGTAVATLQGFLSGYGVTGWLGISFAFGFTLMVLVWTLGPISGCHVNPAVSIAMAFAKRLKWNMVPGYVVAQILGALVASGVLLTLLNGFPGYDVVKHGLAANGNPRAMADFALIGFEVIMTALFLLTIFSVTRKGTPPGVTGLGIGGFLFVAHLVGAPLGDASLNPARSIGPALLQGGAAIDILWIFIVGPIVGGILGWFLYKQMYPK